MLLSSLVTAACRSAAALAPRHRPW